MRSVVIILAALLAMFGSVGALAQTTAPALQRPAGPTPPGQCATGGCHEGVTAHNVLHGPVNVGACEACHTPVDEQAHSFKLAREKGELCTFCHQVNLDAPTVHKPLADGDCASCHDPHGGKTTKFTRGDTMKDLCLRCHADNTLDKKMIHGPVAAGACGACHTPHVSQEPKLLTATGTDLCLSCHTEMKTQMAEAHVKHKAVEQNCINCHDAHASNFAMQIKQPPLELCSSCHIEQRDAAMSAQFKHPVVTQNDACLNCHTAHGGSLSALMKDEPMKICMSCHTEPMTQDGQVLAAGVPEVLESGAVLHGPIRDGNCSGCHQAHGSGNSRLLAKPYPDTFYQAFSIDKYELCFSCHDQQLVLAEKATGLTGFRNGDRNLHFAHVNKQEKGRNCRACHQTHASGNELHVRDSVPFGQWQMPINYEKSDTGGSCSPGCHKPYQYDRDTPVNYDEPANTAVAGQREQS